MLAQIWVSDSVNMYIIRCFVQKKKAKKFCHAHAIIEYIYSDSTLNSDSTIMISGEMKSIIAVITCSILFAFFFFFTHTGRLLMRQGTYHQKLPTLHNFVQL